MTSVFYPIILTRENRTKILEFLRKSWVIDRRTEWSIWMVYSKLKMPHQNMNYGVEGTSMSHGVHRSSILTRRFTDDVIIYYLIFISSVVLWIFFTWSFSSNMLSSIFSIQPIQSATMRAELHRRGISQMRVREYVFFFLLCSIIVLAVWN